MDDIDDVRREVREVEVNAPEATEWGTTGRGAETTTTTTTTTQWQRPSREEAQRHGKATVFGSGRAPVWRTTAMDFAPLGEGVTLYFLMLQWFAWFFVAQTIVSLPAIVFFVSGKAIAEEELDLFGIAKTTLGNFHADNVTAWLSRFHAVTEDDLTEELIEDLGAIPTQPYLKSYIISALDIVNTCLFLLFSLWLKARMQNVSRKADQRFVTTADYAVLVRGLPPDATEEEVRNHFDRLYHLKKMDWTWPGYLFGTLGRKEPRLPPETRPRGTKHKQALEVTEEHIEPIHDTSHIGDPAYQGSWVCEVTLARNQGEIIRAYFARRAAQMRMNEVRAALTKYSEKSKFANKARKRAAEDELRALEARVKTAQEQIAALRQEQGSRPCREAYVIFNYQESRKRCLEDYQTYSKWWHKLPTPLRFRNGKYAIHVSPAPEPTNIKWENQGVSTFESRARQLLVAVVVLAILMGGFTLVYWCQSRFRGLRASLPNADLCVLDVPAVLLGTYNLAKLNPDLQRKPDLDQFCAPSEVWLGYSGMPETEETIMEATSNASDPCATPCVSRPSHGADILCYTLSVEEGCPSTQDPLESANIDATCAQEHWENITSEYIEISSELIADPEALTRLVRAVESVHCCQSFQKSRTLRACYCAQRLHTVIQEVGIFRALGAIEAEDDNLCQEVASDMFLAQVMSASPAVVVICVNTLIRIAMSRITRLEHHATVTDQDMSIALKILAAQFITTAIVILVLNAARASSSIVEADVEASESTGSLGSRIFEAGDYEDFTRTWYAVVGHAIILAMALNIVSVQAFPIFLGYVMAPLRRLYYSTYALTQERLNWAFEGLKFRVTVRYAMLINTIWVTMLYSASMPLVLPCAAMFFTCTYWFDKYAILRYYRRPPAYDASFPLLVVRTLPVALLGHAGFSFWALANDDLVPSQRLTWTAIQQYIQENATGAQLEAWSAWSEWAQSIDRLGVLYKASHLAALPQFLLAIFILAYFGIYALLHTFYLLPRLRVLANFLWKTLKRCFPSRQKILVHPRGKQNIRSEISRMREFLPPFTGYFIREVPSAARLSALQRKMNWHLIHNEDTGTSFEYCTWPSDGAVAGCTHARGDIMKTWELVSTHAVHSYRLESNPFYKI